MTTTAPVVKTDSTVVAPAKTPSAKLTIRQHIESPAFMDAVKKALPKHLTPDRFIRVALTAMTRTPKLAQCDQASFLQQLLTLSSLGLEPDGRRAHLIPFENRKRNCVECQLIIDWKGLAELVMRSGLVSNLHGDVVREGDSFEFSAGKIAVHVPHFLRRDAGKPEKEGKLIAVYALAEFRDGTKKADVMSIAEIDAIRKRSKSANSGPWVTDYNEMAKKTVFRRLSKWLPLSPEFRDALDADDTIDITATPATNDSAGTDGLVAMLSAGSSEAPVVEDSNPDLEAVPVSAATPADEKAERDATVEGLKNLMLDYEVSEDRLWKYAVDGKHVPEGIDELWALPTAALTKLTHAVRALSTKKGAA